MSSKFAKDLALGKKMEQSFLKYIKYDSYVTAPDTIFKPWDIKTYYNDRVTLYEVKSDRLGEKTGNICIEFECNGKASGIITTQSDYYGYFILGQRTTLYIIPTNLIREEIKNKTYNRCIFGGDGYKSQFYLFKKEIFANNPNVETIIEN